jgi:hypothetical protein
MLLRPRDALPVGVADSLPNHRLLRGRLRHHASDRTQLGLDLRSRVRRRLDRLPEQHLDGDRQRRAASRLYRNASKLPFTVRLGRRLRFSAPGIERYIRGRSGR